MPMYPAPGASNRLQYQRNCVKMVRVCFVCSSTQQMQRCFTVLNLQRLHRLIVKLQLPFSNTDSHSGLHPPFFLIFFQRRGGEKGSEEEGFPALRICVHRKYYTHGFPLSLYTYRHVSFTTPTRLFFLFFFFSRPRHVTWDSRWKSSK